MADLAARRIAYFVWNNSGLGPEETIDSVTQAEFAETMQRIIDGIGPQWVLDNVKE